MYQGKHHKRSRRRSGKTITLLVSLLLIIGVIVGGTIAFLMDTDGPLNNLFNPSQVTTKVEETLDGTTKKDVYIENTGDTDAWIRAAVVVTWQDENGNVYGQAPVEGTNYDITWGTGWKTGDDGFYYWTSPVKAESGVTGDLIETISSKGNPPTDGYYLTVEVIGSGIQNKPAKVFDTEWASSGLKVNDNNDDPMQWTLVSK